MVKSWFFSFINKTKETLKKFKVDSLKLGTYINQNLTSACQKSAVEAKLLEQRDFDNIDTTSNWQAMEL